MTEFAKSDSRDTAKKPIIDIKKLENRLRGLMAESPEGIDVGKFLIDSILKDVSNWLPENYVEELRRALSSTDTESGELPSQIANAVNELLSKHFTKKQWSAEVRKVRNENSKFSFLGDVVSYGATSDEIHIHLVDPGQITPGELIVGARKDLQELAKRLESDVALKDIREITAISWIVAKNPKIFELAGFIVDGAIDEQTHQKRFSDEKRPVWKAHISRKDFLKKYGNK